VFEFEITSNCSNTSARTGIFHTPNGQVNTPKFMPVGTLATVKGNSSKQLTSTGSEMILSNTFHLHLQPGEKLVKTVIPTTNGGFTLTEVAPSKDAFFESLRAFRPAEA